MRAGIVGITGYTGVELARLVAGHPKLELVLGAAGTSAGQPLSGVWPALEGVLDLAVESVDAERLASACDVVFLAMPHGHAAALAPRLLEAGLVVVDLGADFRLRRPDLYARYYGLTHPSPGLLDEAVYGLPELNGDALPGARLIACPGCYPTAVTLAARPLLGEVASPIVATCLSGVSGAGRGAAERTRFVETADQARAYGIAGSHRHSPEIEQNLDGASVVFTPHLAPMNRGIVATVVMQHPHPTTPDAVAERYRAAYSDAPMVVLRDAPPTTADVRGTNRVHLHVRHDSERSVTTAVCVIDNLVKGSGGQALQALNLAQGWPETLGLPMHPWLP